MVGISCTRDEAGSYIWEHRGSELLPLSENDLEELVAEVKSFQGVDNIAVATARSYEILVDFDRRTAMRFTREEGVELEDSQSGLKYEIKLPSKGYIAYLALRLKEEATGRRLRLWLPSAATMDRAGRVTILQLASMTLRERSLRITSQTPRNANHWGLLVDACCFHLSYNLDAAVLRQRDLRELTRPLRISRVRKVRLQDLDAPRRIYIPDLINHYQLGVSAESPMLEYLSYYHVAEHNFESIYQKDLVDQVQEAITVPGFSYRRRADIQQLIKKISKAIQIRDEQVIINEQFALQLTLREYVDVDELAQNLRTYDPALLDFYAQNVVNFSKGEKVDLAASDKAQVISNLSKRIYKTRNALVHSKDGAKSRFIPFSDDDELVPEVPLLRFIAEQIIIRTSSLP